MTIRAVGSASTSTPERSSSKTEDSTNADRFAGMFSSAVNTSRHAEKAHQKKDGTSELDKTHGTEEGTDNADEAKDHKKTHSRKHAREAAATINVITSVDALDPELQDKLARVMSRMQEETGKTVTVGETLRTQDRQNALFAQGRQTPGDVVTWTQNSKHTQGRAVDVTVDGGNAEAYQTLQRIANEEGLRTLGAIDPGHLELRGNGPKLDVSSLIPAAPADANGQGQSFGQSQGQNQLGIARIADVARVAGVAHVAPVASVAPVADVAVAQPVAAQPVAAQTVAAQPVMNKPAPGVQTAPMTASAEVAANAAALRVAAARSGNGGNAFGQSAQKDSDDTKGDSANGYAAFNQNLSTRDHSSSFSVPSVGAAVGSDAAARAEQLMSVMDATPARQLSTLTMSLDNPNGTSDKIHLSMRGATLDTTIATSDNRVAQLLNAKSDELSKALSKDGIELRELRVRAATDTNTVTAAAGSQQSQSAGDASNQSRFDRGQAWQRQQDQQDQYDKQRSQQQQRGRQQRQGRGDDQ
jgi:D-alanyl-D-alanine dipeptidase